MSDYRLQRADSQMPGTWLPYRYWTGGYMKDADEQGHFIGQDKALSYKLMVLSAEQEYRPAEQWLDNLRPRDYKIVDESWRTYWDWAEKARCRRLVKIFSDASRPRKGYSRGRRIHAVRSYGYPLRTEPSANHRRGTAVARSSDCRTVLMRSIRRLGPAI